MFALHKEEAMGNLSVFPVLAEFAEMAFSQGPDLHT